MTILYCFICYGEKLQRTQLLLQYVTGKFLKLKTRTRAKDVLPNIDRTQAAVSVRSRHPPE